MQIKIASFLYIAETEEKGRGVFTKKEILPSRTIERSSVLVMSGEERLFIDKTPLHNYIFEWGKDESECCVAWGYVSLYNHSYEANCEYLMDFDERLITIRTVRKISAGEELTINYNGDWDKKDEVWFEAK